MTLQYSILAEKSPIFRPIGTTVGGDSLSTVAHAASKEAHAFAKSYDDEIVARCIDWERTVTTRVDAELEENSKLRVRYNHYLTKVDKLRSKSSASTDKSKDAPKMGTRHSRNEEKLDTAWRSHEQSASSLYNLLEEVTQRGWKDLYRLVKASMQWEIDRESAEHAVFAKLPQIMNNLDEKFVNGDTKSVNNTSSIPNAMVGSKQTSVPASDPAADLASDPAGEYNENVASTEFGNDASETFAKQTLANAGTGTFANAGTGAFDNAGVGAFGNAGPDGAFDSAGTGPGTGMDTSAKTGFVNEDTYATIDPFTKETSSPKRNIASTHNSAASPTFVAHF